MTGNSHVFKVRLNPALCTCFVKFEVEKYVCRQSNNYYKIRKRRGWSCQFPQGKICAGRRSGWRRRGRGGDIVFVVDDGLNTLTDYRHRRKFAAQPGEEGGKRNCHGKNGEDLILKVPAGTVIKDAESGKVIADMSGDNRRQVILKGAAAVLETSILQHLPCRRRNMHSRVEMPLNWK